MKYLNKDDRRRELLYLRFYFTMLWRDIQLGIAKYRVIRAQTKLTVLKLRQKYDNELLINEYKHNVGSD